MSNDVERTTLHRSGVEHELLRKLKSTGETMDMEFVVEGEVFPTHRALIATASSVLCTILTNGMKESIERKVHVNEVSAKTWKSIMDYIYYEEVEVSSIDEGFCLLECGRRFELKELEDDLVSYFTAAINERNCFQILAHANARQLITLRRNHWDR